MNSSNTCTVYHTYWVSGVGASKCPSTRWAPRPIPSIRNSFGANKPLGALYTTPTPKGWISYWAEGRMGKAQIVSLAVDCSQMLRLRTTNDLVGLPKIAHRMGTVCLVPKDALENPPALWYISGSTIELDWGKIAKRWSGVWVSHDLIWEPSLCFGYWCNFRSWDVETVALFSAAAILSYAPVQPKRTHRRSYASQPALP